LPKPSEDEMKRILAKFDGREIEAIQASVNVEVAPEQQVDTRTFWQTYTPSNILSEIKNRLSN
jgi:hypothetical protein